MVITLTSGEVYSPVVDCASEIGRNAAAVVSDETSSGTRSSRAELTAASTGRRPVAICTMIDSVITMALSTSMPSAMMRAASDIWSSPTSRKDITSSDAIIASGTRLATTSPVRGPRKSSITRGSTPWWTGSTRCSARSNGRRDRGWRRRAASSGRCARCCDAGWRRNGCTRPRTPARRPAARSTSRAGCIRCYGAPVLYSVSRRAWFCRPPWVERSQPARIASISARVR